MYIKVDYGFDELYTNSWSGAKDTLETIVYAGKTDELMDLLKETFCDDYPDATHVNDYLWFDADYIFELLGISQESEE